MYFSRLILSALLLSICCGYASAEDNRASIPTFLIAEVWPWGYFDETGKPAGIIYTFASRLSERAGIDMHYRVLPHQRILADFSRGNGDYTMLFQNPEVDRFAERVGIVQVSDILLMTLRDANQKLTLPALTGKAVGYIGGTYYGEDFTQNQTILKLPLTSLDQAIRMLQLGRLDALITSDVMLHHSLKHASLAPELFRARVLTQGQEAYLYASPGSRTADHLPVISAALEGMRASGELEEMFRRSLQLPPIVGN